MKKNLFSILLLVFASTSFAQFQWGIDFDCPTNLDRIYLDTVSNPGCIWQIGQPAKTVFTTAHSIPHSLVTDVLNPVPPNDTSTFYLFHERDNFAPFHIFGLHFWFQMDGDSTDYGTIEISPDNGLTWINILTQDTTYQFNWQVIKPILIGSTTGWQQFSVDMEQWASGWGTFPVAMIADTIQFRFTYFTDSNSTLHDGWIIDDFLVDDLWDGIGKIQKDNLISIYPNPSSNLLTIKRAQNNKFQSIQIINSGGQVQYDNKNFTGNNVDISQLKNGLYFLKYSDTQNFSIKKFIINH